MHHPWRAFRALVDWTLQWAHLPEGVWGTTDFDDRTVTLAHGLNQAERRSTITHESIHAERGAPAAGYEAREERVVDELAARRLITLDQLADALVWAYDVHELADELWVDVPTAETRLRTLTVAEGRELEQRLDLVEA